ncbi:hypothetical protein diail_7195 [Diaporthe ilicicola]|nr:hypothetical protein diail_7195 [Diaporthe ilicicola]
MASPDLQNSYGPEMAPSGHDLPQAVVVGNGLEAMHPSQQHLSTIAPPYNEQHAKDYYQYNNSPPADPIRPNFTGYKKRVLGLPVVLFWGIVIGLVLILAVGLGVGLGVGLSQRNNNGGSAAAATSATSSASADAATTSATSTPTTTSTTSSATSALATARNVEICNQASLVSDSCTKITVPVNTCVDFPSAYNDSVSSLNTGGPECDFYTGETCSGDYWTANGPNYVIPGEYNDAFSSVACMIN